MKIKLCGMREPDNIRAAARLPLGWMGFVFYPPSPRYAGALPPVLLSESWPETIRKTGVFVNETEERIHDIARRYGLDTLQLHGKESPDSCRRLRLSGREVIKAFSVAGAADLAACAAYEGCCDYYLFDTKTPHYGGSGCRFDWNLLAAYRGDTPFLLSGGIGEEQLGQLRRFSHPCWAGIDLNSRFETVPGKKDTGKIGRFLATLGACGLL